jgi:hypothetical protein
MDNINGIRIRAWRRGRSAFTAGLALVLGAWAVPAGTPPLLKVVSLGAGSHEGNGIVADGSGNVYVTGQHIANRYDAPTATAYSDLGGESFPTAGQTDFFLMKLDAGLEPVWTRSAGSGQYDFGTALRLTSDGGVIVSAAYQGPMDLAGNALPNANSGRSDSFVARYTADGSLAWVATANGPEAAVIDDIDLDGTDQVYAVGRLSDLVDFGPHRIGARFQNRIFLAKLDATGAWVWARVVIGARDIGNAAVRVVSGDEIIVAGSFRQGDSGVFLARYNAAGTQTWIRQMVGSSQDEVSDVEVDAAGNIFLSGRLSGASLDFGDGVVLANPGGFFAGFLARLDGAGTAAWATLAGSRGYEIVSGTHGGVVLAGYHDNKQTLLGEVTLGNAGALDAFVAGLDDAGEVSWHTEFGSTGNDLGRAIARDADGTLLVTGEATGTLAFGDPGFRGAVFVARLGASEVTPKGPGLGIQWVDGKVWVSWPTDVTGYELEGTSALGVPFGPLEPAPVPVAGSANTYELDAAGAAGFLRLKAMP